MYNINLITLLDYKGRKEGRNKIGIKETYTWWLKKNSQRQYM